jgi:hypothetical protein
MRYRKGPSLPAHLQEAEGLPRSREERLLWIKHRVAEGYYDRRGILEAVAEAFLDPAALRRAGDHILSPRPGQGR